MIGDINLAVIAAVTIPLYLVLIYLLKVIGQQDWELMKSIVASRKAA
jgi:hypothetical protein